MNLINEIEEFPKERQDLFLAYLLHRLVMAARGMIVDGLHEESLRLIQLMHQITPLAIAIKNGRLEEGGIRVVLDVINKMDISDITVAALRDVVDKE